MNSQPASFSAYVMPVKQAFQRFAYSILLLISVLIIIMGKADVVLIERLRMATADAMAPVLSILAQPVIAITDLIQKIEAASDIYTENERLRAENAALLQWQNVARRLENENTELRNLTNYNPSATSWYVSARVIGTSGGSFSRNVLINRGQSDRVAKGQAATSGLGLVGRVTEVGERAARVLLLTDLNSRIPVTLEGSHDRAILAGDNTDRPQMVYLPRTAQVKLGDRVVTSGDGGVFPPGLPVGTIASLDNGIVRVEPFSDLGRVDYLRLIDFGMSGVLPQNAVPPPRLATTGRRSTGTRSADSPAKP